MPNGNTKNKYPPFIEDKLAFAVPFYNVEGKIVSKEYYFLNGETRQRCRIIKGLGIPTNSNKKKIVPNKGQN